MIRRQSPFDFTSRVGPDVPFVKVCGLTRAEDVCAAVAAGASAVGFVFWSRSPRAVTVDVAARLRALVPDGVAAVGVFVDATAREVNDVAERAGLDAVQLHGDEPSSVRGAIDRPTIKAVVGGTHDAAWIDAADAGVLLLVDARDVQQRGGTGRLADWDAAADLARKRPVVLAGGLTAENVLAAVRRVRPHALDVSSGVEAAPGVKDGTRIAAFFDALRTMEREHS